MINYRPLLLVVLTWLLGACTFPAMANDDQALCEKLLDPNVARLLAERPDFDTAEAVISGIYQLDPRDVIHDTYYFSFYSASLRWKVEEQAYSAHYRADHLAHVQGGGTAPVPQPVPLQAIFDCLGTPDGYFASPDRHDGNRTLITLVFAQHGKLISLAKDGPSSLADPDTVVRLGIILSTYPGPLAEVLVNTAWTDEVDWVKEMTPWPPPS